MSRFILETWHNWVCLPMRWPQWQWAWRWRSVCTDFRITAYCTCSLVKGLTTLHSVAHAQRRPICPLSFAPEGRQSGLSNFIPTVEPLRGVTSAWRSWVTNPKPLCVRTKPAGNQKVTGQWTSDWLVQINLKLSRFESWLHLLSVSCCILASETDKILILRHHTQHNLINLSVFVLFIVTESLVPYWLSEP